MANKISFNISGRTARLIGRENVSSQHGALIELLKNSYDADSTQVFLILDIKYDKVPDEIDKESFQKIKEEIEYVEIFYKFENESYIFDKTKIKEKPTEYDFLELYFKSKNSLYLIDNGEGMPLNVITNSWMTIGTDNKERDHITKKFNRIKTGAKGIGRFALDRLGNNCEVITYSQVNTKINGYKWWVSWEDFEEKGAVIGEVYAYYEEIKNINNYYNYLTKELPNYNNIELNKITNSKHFFTGTCIKISDLRDFWTEKQLNILKDNIETLLPPIEEKNEFKVFLFNSFVNKDAQIGEIQATVCDDYDYKLKLNFDIDNGLIKYTIHQSEVDINKAKKEFNEFIDKKKENYFLSKEISDQININESNRYRTIDLKKLEKIGNFSFTFYYLKRRNTFSDETKFKLKEINGNKRSEWLDQFGGVRIYRDKFRVRPYGEKNQPAFDWLGFGERVASDPTGVGSTKNTWKVRPNQIFGAVDISRVNNSDLFDKSGREGIIENESFEILKNILISFVEILEFHRQRVIRELFELNKKKNPEKSTVDEASEIIKNFKKKSKDSKEKNKKSNESFNEDYEKVTLGFEQLQEEKEELKLENQILRGLASTGLTLAVFTHDLKNYRFTINSKILSLRKAISKLIPEEQLGEIKDYVNPYILLNDLESTGKSLNNWFEFTLETLKRDKRKLRSVNLYEEFKRLFVMWQPTLLKKSINLKIPMSSQKFMKKMFTIDFDSIFNNLIINSIYEFENRKDNKKDRNIVIKLIGYDKNKKLIITYEDSGPGLSREIKDPDDIFKNNFTTKSDGMGQKTGTGLGMWILKNTINDYSGEVSVKITRPGFKIEMSFPLNHGEGVV